MASYPPHRNCKEIKEIVDIPFSRAQFNRRTEMTSNLAHYTLPKVEVAVLRSREKRAQKFSMREKNLQVTDVTGDVMPLLFVTYS